VQTIFFRQNPMRLPQQMYDERLVTPMRQELTRLGVKELRTPEEVDETLQNTKGTAMVIVNSVCGCSARMARPAVAIALQNPIKPDVSTTVFAGQDADATDKARGYFTGYPPSSPQIGLLKDGELVFMLERWQIESRSADEIAHDLVNAFNKFCAA
jgi:putative YphP/YqiW family bacilliredoxin